MAKHKPVPFKDLPTTSIPLFLLGIIVVALCHSQFMLLIDGNNANFLIALMIFGPGCLLVVSFLTTFSPSLCRTHLIAYVALISGVEIGIAVYLGYSATQWYIVPELERIEATVVSLTLVIGCLQWSKRKWELRVKALLENKAENDAKEEHSR
jgi:multisubunit Na+/H+ antiporter MnhC subunit